MSPTVEHEVQRPPPPRAKKSLAQHFLVDRRVLGRIVKAAEVSPSDLVVEVGPGRGSLTRELAKRAGRLVAVELDEALSERLSEEFAGQPNVRVVAADAREVDLDTLTPPGSRYKVVANLPYYAASPIVRRFLEAERHPEMMVVMLQRQVAENMAARPGKMGLLSVAIQVYGKARIVCNVPPKAFRPAPRVGSAVVRIDVYPRPAVDFDSADRFFDLVRAGFSAPRKQIHNCLRRGLDISPEAVAAMLEGVAVDPKRRAETLSLEEWGGLYQGFRRLE